MREAAAERGKKREWNANASWKKIVRNEIRNRIVIEEADTCCSASLLVHCACRNCRSTVCGKRGKSGTEMELVFAEARQFSV